MSATRIILVSGPPGVGKSSVARALAAVASPVAGVHVRGDDFYSYLQRGFIKPWLPAAQQQNSVVTAALVATAVNFALGGYEVVVDGVISAWAVDIWRDTASRQGLELHYVMLLPDKATTIARATGRLGGMKDVEVICRSWDRFESGEILAGHRLESSGQTLAQTVAAVHSGLEAGRFRMT